ncbi:hypothetical protein B0A52_07645 [Exophiala mesophila]|uniref:NAD(P)-binding protein n=1 Tax=Exophiala mesophila TaxID=212818 RepID=A0A438MYG1_EXOME|nr:hypothetical protein B0A52_07645 [Exophiala mesophila]
MAPKTVLITGCSEGGIGYALAVAFAKRQLNVFATARDLTKMQSLSKYSNITLLALDVTDPTQIATVVEQVSTKTGGTLDYLVNNSGVLYIMPALDSDIEEGKKMFEVNFWGVLRMTQAFSPLLVAAKGTVVNIGSLLGYLYNPYLSIYNASKTALHAFDEPLRLELKPLNVKVLTVVTGAIETSIHVNAPGVKLPEKSFYRAVQNRLNALKTDEVKVKRTEAHVYAEKVVNDVLGGASGKTFRGSYSSIAKYATMYLPTFVTDSLLTQASDLDKVTVSVKNGK